MRRAPARPASAGPELLVPGVARIDLDRMRRTGVPEVILAEGKSPQQLARILASLRERGTGAIVSRLEPRHRSHLARVGLRLRYRAHGRIGIGPGPLSARPVRGIVALLTAGTSDRPVADEAQAILEELGATVLLEHDIGVAGLHRLLSALLRTEARHPQVYLVAAGREGALPTVVAGLVGAPVVGIPTSTGYGRGGRGEAALSAMLQSCAPIAVVNIDGGVPAGLFALQLLHRRAPPAGTRPRPPRTLKRPP
ncbi:MAG: nickel pincer cofactor biosynthesis protein LarB [Thermoplasmata archaeon]|nr:nickel pincer cofactor biosynthesis protein LarB [Thermoplasmata archaeon]